jgi:hypothetical protein
MVEHGTIGRYTNGKCRCDECRAGWAAYQRAHKKRTEDTISHTHRGMKERCYNPNSRSYADYGGRGITVCNDWQTLRGFRAYIEANLGPRPEGFTLDRIDNDGNYEPGNVRWASRHEQRMNSRPKTKKAHQNHPLNKS